VRQHVVALIAADRMPIAEGDGPIVAAARGADGAAVLLAAVDPVGEAIVGAEMIELSRRLVIPAAPGPAVIDRDDRPLVGAGDPVVGMLGIDPEEVIVITARRALDLRPGLAAI